MKRTAAMLAGVTLSGAAVAATIQQESTQEEYGTESSIVTEDERQDRTGMSTDTQSEYGTQEESEYGTQPQTTDPYGDAETQAEEPTDEPEVGTMPEAETTYGAEVGEDVSQMSSEELGGKPVMTMEGEEIGTIEQVGYSEMHQDKVGTVNVGGFLGVGEKLIAIPLSDLQAGTGEGLQTTMSREEIQSAEEFDPSNLSTEQQPQQYEQQPYEQQPYEQQQ